MKKIKSIAFVLAVVMMLSALCACGGSAPAASSAAPAAASSTAPAPSSAPAEPASSEPAAESKSSYSYPQTGKENPIFISGEMPKIEGPVLVTSAGQSADTNAMDSILKKAGIDHTTNITASASILVLFSNTTPLILLFSTIKCSTKDSFISKFS